MTLINGNHLGKYSNGKRRGSSLELYLMTSVCSGSFKGVIFTGLDADGSVKGGSEQLYEFHMSKACRKFKQDSVVPRHKLTEHES